MKKTNFSIHTLPRITCSLVVALAGIGVPFYFLREISLDEMLFNPIFTSISFFYLIALTGIVLSINHINGPDLCFKNIYSKLESTIGYQEIKIIKANKTAAFKYYLPLIIAVAVLTSFIFNLKLSKNICCDHIFGINMLYLDIIFITYIFPIFFLLCSMWSFYIGCKVIKHKYYPPLDLPVFVDVKSRKGKLSTIKGVFLMFLPLVFIWITFLGFKSYSAFSKGRSPHEMITSYESSCKESLGLGN